MINKIYKYQLEVKDYFSIVMPKGASILTVQVQQGIPCIWAIVDPEQILMETRNFRIFGTGHPILVSAKNSYIGTFQLQNGGFVGHLFEMN